MTERKRRQGQIRKDGKASTPKEVCPQCGEYLKTAGGREGRAWRRIGQYCPNPGCDFIIKDVIELQDEEEKEETESMNEQNRKLGICPITEKIGYYVPGNWGTESIDCDECPHRCQESRNPNGYENEKGRYHGGSVFPKNGFSIFNIVEGKKE